jgi:hypothetical protein
MEKKCIKCGEVKDIGSFYKHRQMRDGHLNVCIPCKQQYQRDRSRSIEGRLYDHYRNQAKKRKKWLRQQQIIRRKKNPEKYRCSYLFHNALRGRRIFKPEKCSICGNTKEIQGHHPDYNKPFDVIWLCSECHRKQHKQYERKYL